MIYYSEKSIKKAGMSIVATFFTMPSLSELQKFNWTFNNEVMALRLKNGLWAVCLICKGHKDTETLVKGR